MYLGLFGVELVPLLQIHLQAFVRAAVHLGDGWRGGGTHVAVVPAPVAAAAAVGELAAATLHVGGGGGAGWKAGTRRKDALSSGCQIASVTERVHEVDRVSAA